MRELTGWPRAGATSASVGPVLGMGLRATAACHGFSATAGTRFEAIHAKGTVLVAALEAAGSPEAKDFERARTECLLMLERMAADVHGSGLPVLLGNVPGRCQPG